MVDLDEFFDLETIFSSAEKQRNLSGDWFAIQWMPDIVTQEKINIGVGFKAKTGEVSLQMLDHFERIKCLYSEDMIYHAELACKFAQNKILSNGIDSDAISQQIYCDKRGFTQGDSVDAILEELYSSVVTLGRKPRTRTPRKFSTKSREKVYNQLRDKLKENLALEYSNFIPENPYKTVDKLELYLPFRSKSGGAATLASTAYTSPQRIKCNMYEAFRDVDIARSQLFAKEQAIFMLLPGEGLSNSQQIAAENELDEFIWFAKKHNIYVGTHAENHGLADEITEWCVRAA